ncbi:MAG: FHA domain-containing protein [Anaerolineae bacterium]|nr:FHA domain-containing protein [Gloeobacterales cyanobacterium ES-bin-313]
MAAPKCPNPTCEFFNRTLPNTSKFCPMCNTSVVSVVGSPASPSLQPPQPQASGASPWGQAQPQWSPQPVAAQARPELKLIHMTLGREFPVRGEVSFIGRRGGTVKPNPEIDLTGIPNDNVISRPHARISWDPGYGCYIIIDEKSRNGSFINSIMLDPEVPYQLANGDVLQLGKDNLVQFSVKLA